VLDEVVPKYENKINMYIVDIEESPELAAMFGARGIPYMVFITEDGKAVPEAGSMTTDQLKYRLDGLTQK
jgi:thioredoxin-like negative regulator of GroEL